MHVSALCCDTVASPVRPDMSNSVLKTDRGKFIRIDSKLRLCAEDIQNEAENAPQVHIETKDQKRKAYKFPHNGKNYWVKADGRKLELVEDDGTIPFWFEVKNLNASRHYGLQFKHGSAYLYLAAESSGDKDILTITKEEGEILHMTDK